MFELIKVLLELIGKAISPSEISKHVKENKLNELGTQLFLLYIHLNEILVCGEEIVDSLEVYVERMEKHLKHGNDEYALTGGKWIEFQLVEQSLNIAKFAKAIKKLNRELQIVDGDAYRKLHPLLDSKISAIESLLITTSHGNLPVFGPTEQQFLTLSADETGSEFDKLKQIANAYSHGSIQTEIVWDESVYKNIKKYLKERQPREQLKQIQDVAEQLRESLLKYFSITDILVKVGDERLYSNYNGKNLW